MLGNLFISPVKALQNVLKPHTRLTEKQPLQALRNPKNKPPENREYNTNIKPQFKPWQSCFLGPGTQRHPIQQEGRDQVGVGP